MAGKVKRFGWMPTEVEKSNSDPTVQYICGEINKAKKLTLNTVSNPFNKESFDLIVISKMWSDPAH